MTKREQLKEIFGEALTVGELKEFLSSVPDNTPVGVIGHYGEIHFCSKNAPNLERGYVEFLLERLAEDVKIFTLQMPDIGPEPD